MTATTFSTVKVLVPPPVTTPRGARWASAAADLVARFGRSVWAELEAAGYRRAQRELELLGLQYPQLSERAEALAATMRYDALPRESRGSPR
jgi:hypothetical protein